MPDRTINFGESETEATYQIQDTDGAAGGGNFVVAKDTNANTVLLEYDPASDTWEYAGDVDMNGGNVSGVGTLTADSVNTVETHTETIGRTDYHFAGDYNGSTPDERLDNAISAANVGDSIQLEGSTYSTNRTINKSLKLTGTGFAGTVIDGDLTMSATRTHVSDAILNGATVTVDGSESSIDRLLGLGTRDVIVNVDAVVITRSRVDVTFSSGTDRGVADTLFANSTVTDNGANTIGVIG